MEIKKLKGSWKVTTEEGVLTVAFPNSINTWSGVEGGVEGMKEQITNSVFKKIQSGKVSVKNIFGKQARATGDLNEVIYYGKTIFEELLDAFNDDYTDTKKVYADAFDAFEYGFITKEQLNQLYRS